MVIPQLVLNKFINSCKTVLDLKSMPYKPIEFTAGHLHSRCLLLPTYDDEELFLAVVFQNFFLLSVQFNMSLSQPI